MREIFEIVLIVLFIKSLVDCFTYKSTVAALTFRLHYKYDDKLSNKELKEITIKAGVRLVKDFFHLK